MVTHCLEQLNSTPHRGVPRNHVRQIQSLQLVYPWACLNVLLATVNAPALAA
jgi:hypothetical protein